MALTVLRAKVKDLAGIADTASDGLIDTLILDLVPILEFRIEPSHLASSDAGLAATLNRAATEIIAGETLAILARSPGGADRVRLEGLELAPQPGGDDLRQVGWDRLAPFLRDLRGYRNAGVLVGSGGVDPDPPTGTEDA